MELKNRLNDYILGRKLGSGQYSKVREGFRGDKTYAIKYMNKTINPSLVKTCLELVGNEVKVMSQLNHPNIIKLHEYNDKSTIEKANGKKVPVLYLALDLVTGGELFDYVAVSGRFSDKVARYYFRQFIDGLEYIHSKGFAHRDIKAENLLMDSDYILKLADFGFSAPMAGKDGSGKLHTGKGTEGYMAPEILSHEAYSGEKVDFFASGVLLFIMIAQHPPFRRATAQDGFYKLFCKHNDVYWQKMSNGKPPNTFTPEFKELVNSLMAYDPNSRPSIKEIKESKWYNGPMLTEEEIRLEFATRNEKVVKNWKTKAAELVEKKRMKLAQGGLLPHVVLGTKGVISIDATVAAAAKKILPVYQVLLCDIVSRVNVTKQ